jgi:hypothetical protein
MMGRTIRLMGLAAILAFACIALGLSVLSVRRFKLSTKIE